MKNAVRCPFKITFNTFRTKEYLIQDPVFRPANITDSCNPKHICAMSSQGFRTSYYTSKSKNSIDLKELSGAVGMIKVDPHLPAKLLRPLLMNSVAQGDSVTS